MIAAVSRREKPRALASARVRLELPGPLGEHQSAAGQGGHDRRSGERRGGDEQEGRRRTGRAADDPGDHEGHPGDAETEPGWTTRRCGGPGEGRRLDGAAPTAAVGLSRAVSRDATRAVTAPVAPSSRNVATTGHGDSGSSKPTGTISSDGEQRRRGAGEQQPGTGRRRAVAAVKTIADLRRDHRADLRGVAPTARSSANCERRSRRAAA